MRSDGAEPGPVTFVTPGLTATLKVTRRWMSLVDPTCNSVTQGLYTSARVKRSTATSAKTTTAQYTT